MPRLSGRESYASRRPSPPADPGHPPARPYQVEGREFLQAKGRALLADEPGLGKSRQLIEASHGRTLVIAPAMVLDGGTWRDEWDRWGDGTDRLSSVPFTGLNERKGNSPNLGTKKAPTYRPRPEYSEPYDTVIVDEAHYLKGRSTSWVEALRRMHYGDIYLATGTPFPNWADELFVPLQFMYPEEAKPGGRFGSYWRWAKEWFDCSPNRWSQGAPVVGDLIACGPRCLDRPAYDPCDHYLEFASANLGDRYLRRLRDQVLTDLPPLTEQRIEIHLTPAQRKMYRELKKDYITWAGDGTEIVAWNDAAKHVRLDRLATGVGAVDGSPGLWKESESAKLQRLVADLSGRSRPTLVVGYYQESVDGLAAYIEKKLGARVGVIHGGISRPARARIVTEFKAGRVDALFASIDTIAEGLTLTQADMCIFVEKGHVPSKVTQAMRRIHRLGQDRPVTVLDYVAMDTVDERKRENLLTKSDRQVRHLTAADLAALI